MMFRPMRIGFDYDEPIFPWYDYAHDVSVAAGLADPSAPPPTEWDPSTTYGCTLDEWYAVLDDEVRKGNDGMYMRPVKPGVRDLMMRLYRAGHEIHIVTARGQFGSLGEDIKVLTRRNILVEKIPYDTLTFSTDKGKIARELGLDYFLDDRTSNYLDVLHAGVDSFLLTERWNKDDNVNPSRRMKSTEQYVKMIIDRHGWQNPLTREQRQHVNG